jgi:MFS family permease
MAVDNSHNGGDLRERPIGELLKQLSEETTTLVKQELDLAKAEVAQKGQQAGKGIGMFGGAGVVGFMAFGALTAFFILLLDGAVPNWAAALIVAAVYGAVAGVLALQGRNKLKEASPPVPEQAVDSVKEDVQWAKTQTQSARK